jgi:peptidoglycan/LPS O-acetylase OafA/YrhL
MKEASLERLPFLDSARGLAALSVITWHCYTAVINQLEASNLNTSPFHLFWYGEADVIFFFIHSGFILSYSNPVFNEKFSVAIYLRYIIKRVFRIYPLFLAVLLLSYCLKMTIYPIQSQSYLTSHFSKFWSSETRFTDVINQGLLVIRIPESASERLIPQDWTLSIEMLVCPLIPLLNFLNHKSKLLTWSLVFLLLKLFHFNTFLFEFAVGAGIYCFRNNIRSIWSKFSWPIKTFFFWPPARFIPVFGRFLQYSASSGLLFLQQLTGYRLYPAVQYSLSFF